MAKHSEHVIEEVPDGVGRQLRGGVPPLRMGGHRGAEKRCEWTVAAGGEPGCLQLGVPVPTALARLKGTRGSQSYLVPPDRTPRPPVTVLIWCRVFDTPVANATIR